jgi:hypothetical protein
MSGLISAPVPGPPGRELLAVPDPGCSRSVQFRTQLAIAAVLLRTGMEAAADLLYGAADIMGGVAEIAFYAGPAVPGGPADCGGQATGSALDRPDPCGDR